MVKTKDLIIVVSAIGRFATLNESFISTLPAEKILITASVDQAIQEGYDQTIVISSFDHHGLKTAHEKYGIAYLFDNLFSCYIRQYG